jgi:thiamine-monophosphate kinase
MTKTFLERDLIERIQSYVETTPIHGLIKGIGDDCAVFGKSPSEKWLISTDMLVDHIHFNRRWHPPRLLGRKSIAVNMSDIAAMGGIPRFFLLSLCLPSDLSSEWLLQWLEGVTAILAEYGCVLIGGDTVSGRELNISVTVIGEQHLAGILYRTGAQVGDTVYVSGALGSAAAGLAVLQKAEETGTLIEEWLKPLINAHLDPMPMVHLGQMLCASGYVTAMQDISDGIATDLGHICKESQVRAVINEHCLPSLPILDRACTTFGLVKEDCLLRGGEDYQLVFTVKRGDEKGLEKYLRQSANYTIHPVGTIEKGQGLYLEQKDGHRKEITFQGYEHLV